jgi:hypothetical protein
MMIDRLIRRILPRTDTFLNLFVDDIENIAEATNALQRLIDAPTVEARDAIARTIEDLEHRGDEFTHAVFRQLGLTFITTIDREDIGRLASSLDNILDNVDQAATRIRLYEMASFDDAMRALVRIIHESVAELRRAMPLLRDLKNVGVLREACVRINAFENHADDVYHQALGRLFHEEKDPIQLIKRKDLLGILESATDRCEDAAVLIQDILVKHG